MEDKTRIHYIDGTIVEYKDAKLAYTVWLALPRGTRAAFRGVGDKTPVLPHDYADRP